MRHIKTYQQINESKSTEFELLIKELISEMTHKRIISFDNLYIDNGLNGKPELIKIEGLCSIWIMETGLICYYPGEFHAMIAISPPQGKDESIYRLIGYPEGLSKVEKDLKKKIRRLKNNTIENKVEGDFPFKYPDFSYKEKEVTKLNLSPEMREKLRKMIKDL